MTTFLGIPTAPRGVGHLRGDEPFPVAARKALANTQLRRNLGKATTTIRAKRAAVVAELPDWEELRAAGQAIKAHTMRHLDHYLTELETQVTARGGTVHWARDAIEANRIVTGLVRGAGAAEVVKVKSIVTDEIGLNDALAERSAFTPTRPTSRNSSFSWEKTGRRTSWCPRSTATGRRSATSSCARWATSTRG